jgi:tripartite ATP-independent transporter DctP family solute receptor
MNMTRRGSYAYGVLAAMVAIGLALGGAAWGAQPMVLKGGHLEIPGSAHDDNWHVFANYVNGTSGGRLKVEVYPGGQLGSDSRQLFESVKLGVNSIGQGDEGAMASFYPPLMILAIPYMVPNEKVAQLFYDSPFFEKLNQGLIKQQGVRMLSAASFGFRCFTNNQHPIKTAADLKGIKMRVQQNPLYMTMVRSMGGSPTPISWGELYSALQQGVVDGQENPLGVIYDFKFYEVQKYATVDNHVLGTNMILANEKWFQGLPQDLKTILLTGAKMGAITEHGKRMYEARVSAIEELRKKGMEVYVPTPAEVETFRKASQGPVVEWLAKQPGVGQAMIDEAFKTVKDLEQSIVNETQPVK